MADPTTPSRIPTIAKRGTDAASLAKEATEATAPPGSPNYLPAQKKTARGAPPTAARSTATSTLHSSLPASSNAAEVGGDGTPRTQAAKALFTGPAAAKNSSSRFEALEGTIAALREALDGRAASCQMLAEQLVESKARVEELQRERESMQHEMVSLREQVEKAPVVDETVELQLREQVKSVSAEREQLLHQLKQMDLTQSQLQAEIGHKNQLISKIEAQLANLTKEKEQLVADLKRCQEELNLAKADGEQKARLLESLHGQVSQQGTSMASLASANTLLTADLAHWKQQASNLDGSLHSANASIGALQEKLRQAEALRRRLHNAVQELRGNIRVFCRVRPALPAEPQDEVVKVSSSDLLDESGKQTVTVAQSLDYSLTDQQQQSLKHHSFAFDRVFGPQSSQEAVFTEISQLVQSALDGFRVCIFAYGQTGSGKTFTMEGTPGAPGMIPLAVRQIFAAAGELQAHQSATVTMECSFLEIYNENIRDLLSPAEGLDIRHLPGGVTQVPDLCVVSVESVEQVLALLAKAASSRAVAETLCNDRSSRSHRHIIDSQLLTV